MEGCRQLAKELKDAFAKYNRDVKEIIIFPSYDEYIRVLLVDDSCLPKPGEDFVLKPFRFISGLHCKITHTWVPVEVACCHPREKGLIHLPYGWGGWMCGQYFTVEELDHKIE